MKEKKKEILILRYKRRKIIILVENLSKGFILQEIMNKILDSLLVQMIYPAQKKQSKKSKKAHIILAL